MLSINLIERFFRSHRHEQLLDNLAANGLSLPLPLQIRLAQMPAAAVALGLRRLIELTYGPTPLSRAMTASVLAAQDPDGSFEHDPLATAAVVAGLGKLLSEPTHRAAAEQVAAARERALAALAAMQDQDALFHGPSERTEQDRAMAAAFIVLLLGRDDAFRATVRSAELLDWFEQRHEELEPQTRELWALASAVGSAAPQLRPAPALASIAA